MSIGPLGTKLQWNFNQNTKLFIHENAFQNIVYKMAAICPGRDELTNFFLDQDGSGPTWPYLGSTLNVKAAESQHWVRLFGYFGAKPLQDQSWWPRSILTYDITKWINSSPGQNGCHFADIIFRCIFMNEKVCILIQFSLKFVPNGPIDNNPTLV